MNRKIVYLSDEQINDLINLINTRMMLGVNGNLIGEAKSVIKIITELEMGLLGKNEVKTDEVKTDEIKKDEIKKDEIKNKGVK